MNKSSETDLSNYLISGEWELRRITVERNVRFYPCCPDEPFPDVIFYIHIRRRVLYYLFNIILPCVWLSILSLIAFWLPPDSGEKITLGITVLLAFSVFMLLIAENIPATSEMVPLIGIYLTVTMSLTSMSILLTVLVLQLHHATQFAPKIPPAVYYVFTRRIARWVGMQSVVKRFEKSQIELISAQHHHHHQQQQQQQSRSKSGSKNDLLKSEISECRSALDSIRSSKLLTSANSSRRPKKSSSTWHGSRECLSCFRCGRRAANEEANCKRTSRKLPTVSNETCRSKIVNEAATKNSGQPSRATNAHQLLDECESKPFLSQQTKGATKNLNDNFNNSTR